MKMKYLVDPETDNFVKYYLDNPNFYIVVCVILIFKDWIDLSMARIGCEEEQPAR